MRRMRTRRERSSRGQSLVEFAIILPVFILVIGGAIDLGRLFFAYVATESSAKEGAMYGATNPRCDRVKLGCVNPSTVSWHVTNELSGVSNVTQTVECLRGGTAIPVEACQRGDRYRVTVNHVFNLVTPILAPIVGNSLELRSRASSVVINDAFDPNTPPVNLRP